MVIENMQKFCINESTKFDNIVEAWSTTRLPFEPSSWLTDMKNSLSEAIQNIQPEEDSGLYASYTSEKVDNCDVENILLYNVGTEAFSNLCNNSLCIERQLSNIPQPPELENMKHHYFYEATNKENDFRIWKKKTSLAKWENVKCDSLCGDKKHHTFWDALKNGQVDILCNNEEKASLGLIISIKSPKGEKINLATVVKPLIDGVVSAFHLHNKPTEYSIEKLSSLLKENPSITEDLLSDTKQDILGKRNLLCQYRNGVMWNPADDMFIAIKIKNDYCLDCTDCLISGEIITLEKQND